MVCRFGDTFGHYTCEKNEAAIKGSGSQKGATVKPKGCRSGLERRLAGRMRRVRWLTNWRWWYPALWADMRQGTSLTQYELGAPDRAFLACWSNKNDA